MNQQQKQQEVPAKKFDVRVGNMTFRGITRKEIAELRQQMNERQQAEPPANKFPAKKGEGRQSLYYIVIVCGWGSGEQANQQDLPQFLANNYLFSENWELSKVQMRVWTFVCIAVVLSWEVPMSQRTRWESDGNIGDGISLILILFSAFLISLLSLFFLWVIKLLGFPVKYDGDVVFLSVFLLLSVLLFFVRFFRRMEEEKRNKSQGTATLAFTFTIS